ncbi:FapA family protein [Patescibacteria group bacterium]|nr:FapA family protein [Patescibacteria group bacterium]
MKLKKLFIPTLLFLFLIPTLAFALNFEVGEEILSSETINDDYYGAGGTIQMDSDVNGDLILGGGRIMVDAVISQDLMLGGGEIRVKGEVRDDARVAGGNIMINALIKDDLIVAGGNIELGENGFVGSDMTVAGGNVVINGQINGSLQGTAGNLYINNVINGDVSLISVEELTFGPQGKVMGNLLYRSSAPSKTANEDTVLGVIDYKPTEFTVSNQDFRTIASGVIAGLSVFSFLSLLLAGLIILVLFRFYMPNAVQTVYQKPMASVGIGFLVLILMPIAAVLFLITGIGWIFFFILLALWLIALFFAKLIAALMIGMKLVRLTDKSGFLRVYGSFALGALIYVLLTLIPIVGWIIKFALILMGLGGMALYETGLFKDLRKKKLV